MAGTMNGVNPLSNLDAAKLRQTRTLVRRKIALEEQIEKLNAIGIALSSVSDLNRLLELIVTEARHFTHADGGSLYIIEGDRLNFTVAQTESLEIRDGKKQRFKSFYLPLTGESIAGHVAITGEVLNVEDVYNIPATTDFHINKQFDRKNNYRSKSMLVVPMRDHSEQIIGVLQLINSLDEQKNVISFNPEFESLILSLASQAAVAIRNVKLIAEIRNLFKSLVRYSVKAIDARSPHTAGHSGRVARYSVFLAQAVNEETSGRLQDVHFTPEEIEELRVSAWLHDIGKIGVRESVLEKMHKLNTDQMRLIETRFNYIKSCLEKGFLQKQIKCLQGNENRINLTELHTKLQDGLRAIDTDFGFIKKINIPGFLQPEDQAKLQVIFQKTYRDAAGQQQPFLTAFEYEHLSVVKGNLTANEYEEVQSHVEQTTDILKKIPFTNDLKNVPAYAAAHHEYLDGSGYPLGLKGEDIPLQSRIICIADIFDAISSPDRPYKKATPVQNTLEILKGEAAAGKLDKELVNLFVRKKIHERSAFEEEE